MTDNRDWLKSLSANALAEEIKYGKLLAETGWHREHYKRELQEAIEELQRREAEKK